MRPRRRSALCFGLALSALLNANDVVCAGILDATWTAPTTNIDGSPLMDLASYRVYYGTATSPCPGASFAQVAAPTPSPGTNQAVNLRLSGLATGTLHRVSVTAVNADGSESACSGVASAVPQIAFAVSPAGTVDFGGVSIGSSATRTFTVSNPRGGTVSGIASVSAPFSIVSGSPFTLVGSGATQTVTVRFAPTTPAISSTNVRLSADGDTITTLVTGTGSGTDSLPPTVAVALPTSSPTYSTSASSLTLGGTTSDNVGVTQVTWTNSRGGSGAATGTTSWTASGISLQPGANVLVVTARDAAGNTGTATLTVALTDTAPPSLTVTSPTSSPTFSTGTSPLTLRGTASDNVGVSQVAWTNSRGGSGAATGTTSWAASGIVLQPGVNVLVVTARDAGGNAKTVTLTVTYTSIAFTDDPLVAQSTIVKTLHIQELRTAINSVRTARGLANFVWTDLALVPGIQIRAVHIAELRTALNQAYQAAGRGLPVYTEPSIGALRTAVKAMHLNELRTAVRGIL